MTDFSPGSDAARAVVTRGNGIVAAGQGGKIVVAGHTSTGGDRFFLARYHAEAFDDTPPNTVIDSGPSARTNDPNPTFR